MMKLGLHMTFLHALQTRKVKQYGLEDFRAGNLVPKDWRITIVHKKPTNVCGWEGRSACSLCKIMINKSRVMAGVQEGGYVAENWHRWDSNSYSHYKSLQILFITVYHKKEAVYLLFLPPKPSPAALPFCFRGTTPAASSSFIRYHHGLFSSWHTILSTSHYLHPSVTTQASAAHLLHQNLIWSMPCPPDPPHLPSDFECIHYSVHCSLVAGSSAAL